VFGKLALHKVDARSGVEALLNKKYVSKKKQKKKKKKETLSPSASQSKETENRLIA
jgi:hypothetical protein